MDPAQTRFYPGGRHCPPQVTSERTRVRQVKATQWKWQSQDLSKGLHLSLSCLLLPGDTGWALSEQECGRGAVLKP